MAARGLTIGAATVAVGAIRGRRGFVLDRLHRPFVGVGGAPRLTLTVSPLDATFSPTGTVRFDSGIGWQVREGPEAWTFLFWDHTATPVTLSQAATVDRQWRRAAVYLPAPRRRPAPFFLAYPLEQLLFLGLLTRARGLIVHATGLIHAGQGWIFAGTHGAGKSTIARLLGARPGTILLSDDRVVLRRVGRAWRVYGTPWSGTVRRLTSPASAPLRGVFFIRHGQETKALPLTPADALRRLIPRCLHPQWDRRGLEMLLESTGAVAHDVPGYDLPFVPEPEALALVIGDTAG